MNDNISLHQFAEKTLGITLWPKIEEIFKAVEDGKRKILIRSCNGAGKTCALAAICNWKLKTTNDSIVLTTASSHTQVKRNLWGEIRKQAKLAELFEPKQISETFIKITDKHYAIGISPAQPENAAGFHAEKMLIIVDEATGVSRDIMNALFGNVTGKDAQIILAYNPLDTDSYPFEAEHTGDWYQIHISAFDHPNLFGVEEVEQATLACGGSSEEIMSSHEQARVAYPTIPGAVSTQWIEDMLPTWSYEVEPDAKDKFAFGGKFWRKTAEVSARILGEWPGDTGDGFIPMYLIKRSVNLDAKSVGRTFLSDSGADKDSYNATTRTDRNVRPTKKDRPIKAMGVDIARSGKDETVFAFFDGNVQLPLKAMRTKDLVEIAAKIEAYYHEGWKIIAIDETGVGGGVVDILRSNGVPCFAVNFASAAKGILPNHRRDIANARAEMYFLLDDELKKKEIKLTDDHKLHQELAAIRIHHGGEKYILESKEEIKKRLGRSPDRADATVLARYAVKLAELGKREKFK